MNPIYKFQLSAGNTTQRAFPVYKDDLAIDYALEQNQEFYRGKLSGKLTFQRDDYTFIVSKAFDTQFILEIFISYDAGQSWTSYWRGTFWKTDCDFDGDAQTVVVQPTVLDQYNDILAGMEKEYNLIDLAPVIQPVKLDKRPMIQVYVPGQTVIGCFLSGMWWEQECNAVDNESELENTYHFAKNKTLRIADISGSMSPQLPDIMTAQDVNSTLWSISGGGFTLRYAEDTSDPEDNFTYYEIVRNSDNVRLWYCRRTNSYEYPPQNITLTPVSGTDASGNVTLYIHDISVYARYVCDVEQALGLDTYPIPDDDIVENNRNYHYVIGYYFPNTIWFSDYLTTTPTQWGIYQPGQYYVMFTNIYIGVHESFPVARSAWGRISIWFAFDTFDWITETYWRKEYTLKDAFPIWSVISVLLAKVAPGITHDGTTDYSRFLYDTNPIAYIDQRLFITPKSNLISSGYDQPAQKAPITLKRVTDMLRDCFRCYWFIDEQNRFRIEHISYFMRGGTYTGQPVVGIDLTQQIVTRNGKPWAYARNQYEFDKPEMAARYQFGWMDDVTQLFDGYPIDIISKYVNPDNIEQIDVSQFTSDVDYILLNPGAVSKDGFVLLGAQNNVIKSNTVYATAGTGYNNTINVDIPANTNVVVSVVGSGISDTGLFALLINGQSYTTIAENGQKTINVPYAITTIGIGRAASGVIGSGNVTLSLNISQYALPYVNFNFDGNDHILQNAWVSFMFLQRYYLFDMPAWDVEINGVQQWVRGIKKLKTQTIKFPVLTEPDMFNLIKTGLGNGTIQKMSVNLSSRNANTTLKYDTE